MRMGMLHGGTIFGLPSLDGVVCARKKVLGEPKQYPHVWCAGPHGRAMSLVFRRCAIPQGVVTERNYRLR